MYALLLIKQIIQTRDRMMKNTALQRIIFRSYLRRTMRYFLRWKLKAKISKEAFNQHLLKFMRIRKVFRSMSDRYKNHARNALSKWSFQTKQGFPFYRLAHQSQFMMEDFFEKVNVRIEKYTKKRSQFHYHQLFLLLEQFCCTLQNRFYSNTRWSIRKMKVLFEAEQKVIDIQQPLLIRTLSVNLPYFKQVFHSSLKNVELTPGAIVSVMDGNRKLLERKKKRPGESGESTYYDMFLDKITQEKDRQRDAHYLVKGIWATTGPFFKLREYAMVKLLYRNYIKWVSICYTKLKFNRDLSNMVTKRRAELEVDNTNFRRIWSRLMLVTMIAIKTEVICNNVMIAFEANKMKKLLGTDEVKTKPSQLAENLLKLQALPDYEEVIRETFRKRLNEVKRTFAKNFLLTILRPGIKPKEIRKDLITIIIDSMHYMVYGTIEAANNPPSSQRIARERE